MQTIVLCRPCLPNNQLRSFLSWDIGWFILGTPCSKMKHLSVMYFGCLLFCFYSAISIAFLTDTMVGYISYKLLASYLFVEDTYATSNFSSTWETLQRLQAPTTTEIASGTRRFGLPMNSMSNNYVNF